MNPNTKTMIDSACISLAAIAQRIEAETKEAIASGDHLAAIRHYVELDEANDRMRAALRPVTLTVDHLNYSQLPEIMKLHGVKSVKLDGIGLVKSVYKWSATILEGQKLAAFAWLKSHDLGDLITETVNSQTLSATAKGLSDDQGLDLPGDIFKSGPKPYISITRTK